MSEIPILNGAKAIFNRSPGGHPYDILVVSFPSSDTRENASRIFLDLDNPLENSQLQVADDDGYYSVANPSPELLATTVTKLLDNIAVELEKKQTEQVGRIQLDVSKANAVLEALDLKL